MSHVAATPCVLWVAVALVVGASRAAPAELRLYVATNGRNEWSGRLPEPRPDQTDGPVATLGRARDFVREHKARQGLAQPVTVVVRGGTYYLAEPFVLGPQDSGAEGCPITYRAQAGETVVLSGGRPIRGPWTSDDGRVFRTHLPQVQTGNWRFRQLRVGEERQTQARYPNYHPDNPYLDGWLHVAGFGGEANQPPGMRTGLGCLQQKDTWLEYDIDVPADGEYAVRVYYANSGDTNMRFFKFRDMSGRTTFSIDGGPAAAIPDLTDTGSFYSGFRWARAGKVRLAKGKHVFRWHNAKGGALSLLAFLLCDDAESGDPLARCFGPNAPPHVLFQAEAYQRRQGDLVRQMHFADRRDPQYHHSFAFAPGDLEHWPKSDGVELCVIPEYDWVNEIVRLERVDWAQRRAYVAGANCTKPFMPGNRYFLLNVLEKLDLPGEWCLVHKSGTLHYWPKDADFQQREIVAPVLDRVIELRGSVDRPVSHVRIEGFTITDTGFTTPERLGDTYHADDAALWLWAATHCRIEGNTFRGVGGYGVMLRDGSTHNEILGNEVVHAGQGGVYLNGFADQPRKPAPDGRRPAHNLVAGNHVHHGGEFYVHVAGVYLACADHNRVAHNLIHDMPRYGISLKQNCPGSVIEFNEVRRTNLATRDTGAIEMAGNKAGTLVRCNLIVDTIGCGYDRKVSAQRSPEDACGIYLDNMSSKVHVIDNVVVRAGSGLWLNWGSDNVIENNVFIDGRDSGVSLRAWRDAKRWHTHGNVFRRNILYASRPGAPTYQISGFRTGEDAVRCDHNVVHCVGGAPTIAGTESWDAWRAGGQDVHSVVADPLLANPQEGDCRLGEGSPALALGFRPIDMSQIGLKGYRRE